MLVFFTFSLQSISLNLVVMFHSRPLMQVFSTVSWSRTSSKTKSWFFNKIHLKFYGNMNLNNVMNTSDSYFSIIIQVKKYQRYPFVHNFYSFRIQDVCLVFSLIIVFLSFFSTYIFQVKTNICNPDFFYPNICWVCIIPKFKKFLNPN